LVRRHLSLVGREIRLGAVNATLTIIANALRVGDHLLERLG